MKESKLQPLQLLPTKPCIKVGQDIVVADVVVINAPYPSLSLKNRTQVNYNPQPKRWLCVYEKFEDFRVTFKDIEYDWLLSLCLTNMKTHK